MTNLLDEIKVDLAFVRSHTLQPKWYKALKIAFWRASWLPTVACLV